MLLAHIAGMPVEVLVPLASGGMATGMLLVLVRKFLIGEDRVDVEDKPV